MTAEFSIPEHVWFDTNYNPILAADLKDSD